MQADSARFDADAFVSNVTVWGLSLWEILVEVPTVILGLYKSDIAAEETGACHMALL